MKCPKCAKETGSGRFCSSCGTAVAAADAPAEVVTVCPLCGANVRPGSKFCGSCAAPLGQVGATHPSPEMTICVNCGAETSSKTKFCKSCGKSIIPDSPVAATSDLMPT